MNKAIRIHPADDVVVARGQLLGGTVLEGEDVTVTGLIPPGHKVAVRAIRRGQPVRRYNQITVARAIHVRAATVLATVRVIP